MGGGVGVGGGGIPSDYLVSTQLQLWLFCCWGCGCCWAVTIVAHHPHPTLSLGTVLKKQGRAILPKKF